MTMDLKRAVELSREYLDHPEARERLREELDAFEGDLDAAVAELRPTPPADAPRGWSLSRTFESPGLEGKYPEQPITVYCPPDYDPAKPRGLVLFLHGGGHGRGDGGLHTYKSQGINDLFLPSGRIVCYPSAPPHDRSWARWHLPEAEGYLADVITELEHLYNIDPNDVILGGISMGGMGAYHLSRRMADRFASFFAASGCWDFAFWPSLTGTTFWILHGLNDATLFRRRHGTDVAFARIARQRLVEAGVDHVYREHSGGHALLDGRPALREWLETSRSQKRDAHYPHVVAVTPRGCTPWCDWRRHKIPLAAHQNRTDFHDLPDSPHARWVTIDGVGDECLMYDMMTMSDCRDAVEEDWNNIAVTLKRKHIPGGLVEATICDKGTIEVTVRNVTGFTLWLHPEMVDFSDVRVIVRGEERFRGALRPSLATLLDSYLRRQDWGLLYPARITIEGDETWETKDQLQLKL